jgi:tetratricopeptide (TPR) repeat protein
MSEAPPSQLVRRGPPPIPRGETSASAQAPTESPLDELIALCAAEAESTDQKKRAADLKARVALMWWDARGDAARAQALLDKLDHPLAPNIRLALAVEARDDEKLAACVADSKRRPDRAEMAELGTLLFWRGKDALDLLKQAGEEGAPARRLALAVAGAWSDLCEALSEVRADRDALIEGAQVAQDRLGDAARAKELLQRAWKKGAPTPYLIERLLETAEGVETLRAKLEAAPAHGSTKYLLALALEASGGQREAAELLSQLSQAGAPSGEELVWRGRARLEAMRGDWKAAADAWEQLSQLSHQKGEPSWSMAYLRRAAELCDARAGDPARAEALYVRLEAADPSDGTVARALARLRMQRGAYNEAAQALEIAGRAQGEAGLSLVVLATRGQEAQGDPGKNGAAGLIQRWREIAAANNDRNALEALARAYRRSGEVDKLVVVYRQLGAIVEPRRAATYLAVAGALWLDGPAASPYDHPAASPYDHPAASPHDHPAASPHDHPAASPHDHPAASPHDHPAASPHEQGDHNAELCFDEAFLKEPDDLLVHAGRVALYRRAAKFAELQNAIKTLIGFVRSKEAQARLYRQAARVAAEQLGDTKSAQESYEKALELHPEDVTTLHAFAQLLGQTGRWARAVEMREKAAQKLEETAGPRAAAIFVEIGEIYEKRLGDDENARKAFDRALARDERSLPALEALAALHRKHRRMPDLLDVLRRELKLAADKSRQMELYLEIAKAADVPDGDVKAALAAYRDALRIDPHDAGALVGLEKLCRRENEWDTLAEALRRAPRTVKSLRSLGEALERLERWQELAEAHEAELQLLSEPKDVARAARVLAELYERRMDDLDAAARAWHRVDEVDPKDPEAARALQRIYEARGRYADLAAAVERELQIGEAQLEPARRLELWLKLGEIRRARLSRPESAAEAYEKALEVDAGHADALAALAEIYAATKRADDLNRVLDLRAAATSDPQQRAGVLQQKGDLLERSNDLDGALAAYAESFKLDPASRTCFTAYERVCYRREKWRLAMELYETAIRLVEVQRSRAYRLADLYARRGQLQLQYLGQPGEAAASYLKVLELDPEADTAQTALERIFSAQSDWQGLISSYERRGELVRDDAKRVEILRRAARVAAAKLKDAVEASRLYGRLHSVDPTDAEALDALERHYERVRDWEKLVGILTTRLSLTAGGDEAIALYLRIAHMCEDGLHDASRAIDAYRKILDIAPNQKEAIEALARLFEGTERWAELIEVTRRQIRIVNDRAQKAILYFKCGSVMESKFAKEDDAIRYYDAAIKTSPSCLPAVHGLRDLYLRKEDWPRVIQTLELEAKLWTDDKERAGVFAHIGQIYGEKLGDRERAIQYYESALTVDKECLPANRQLFELYFARGEFMRALPIAVILTQKVTREGDPVERSEFYRKRAIVADRTGDRRAAAESLVVALEIRPENMEALDLLVQLCRASPDAYDFVSTFRELDRLYRKRDTSAALARVLIAQGALREREYDIDAAEAIYLEAFKMAPDEYRVVEALVSLHERLRRFDAGAAVMEAFIGRAPDLQARSAARYRLAEILGDGAMDPARAAQVLEELIQEDPHHREAWFRLAQEQYLLGRYTEAHRACERLIALSAAPGHTVPPDELARYYDYLGRIAESSGDTGGAVRAYRRAVDLDPSYPPAALSLARRAVAAGDRAHAQVLIDEALRAAEGRGPHTELALRRGLARFYVAVGEPTRAIESYRSVIERFSHGFPEDGSQLDDRVSLAEMLAQSPDRLPAARDELMTVLSTDLKHGPAYRLLMQVYQRAGELDRAARIQTMLTLLGYADASERPPGFRAPLKRGTLAEDLRRARLLPAPVLGVFTEALVAVREQLEARFPVPMVGQAVPVAQLPDPGFKVCVVDVQRLFGVQPDVFISDVVPGGVLLVDLPRPMVFFEQHIVDLPDGERRFLLGRALEPLRGGYSLVTRLDAMQRLELAQLLEQLVKPEGDREADTIDFIRALPRKAQKALEKLQGQSLMGEARLGMGTGGSAAGWYTALSVAADRAGLLACDDVGAAAHVLARLSGESHDSMVAHHDDLALGQVAGVAELVRFFLSDAYHELRSQLGEATRL